MNKKLDKSKILKKIALLLENFHGIHDINWEKFLSPYIYSIMHEINDCTKDEEILKNNQIIEIPHANNDFIPSIENKGYYYSLLKNGNINLNCDTIIKKPSLQYFEKYIFPYSNKSKIAYLSFFPSKFNKYLFYAIGLLNVKKINFENIQTSNTKIFIDARENLLASLIDTFGTNYKKELKLISYLMPSIYIENFKFYYDTAKNEFEKLKKINVIFFIRHFIFNPTFLILLSFKECDKKILVTFQHGACYGQTSPGWSEIVEKKFCNIFLTWGFKHDERDWPFYSLRFKKSLLNSKPNYTQYSNAALIILPLIIYDKYFKYLENSFKIIKNNKSLAEKSLHIRFDPRETRKKEIISILKCTLGDFYTTNEKCSLVESSRHYKTIIFTTPNATGYLELINKNIYPFMFFHRNDFKIKDQSIILYNELKNKNIWVDYDNANITTSIEFNKEQIKFMNKFKTLFLRSSIMPYLKLYYLLLRISLAKPTYLAGH